MSPRPFLLLLLAPVLWFVVPGCGGDDGTGPSPGVVADEVPPRVEAVEPADGALVGVDTRVRAIFSEPIARATVDSATFRVVDVAGATTIAGALAVDDTSASFTDRKSVV